MTRRYFFILRRRWRPFRFVWFTFTPVFLLLYSLWCLCLLFSKRWTHCLCYLQYYDIIYFKKKILLLMVMIHVHYLYDRTIKKQKKKNSVFRVCQWMPWSTLGTGHVKVLFEHFNGNISKRSTHNHSSVSVIQSLLCRQQSCTVLLRIGINNNNHFQRNEWKVNGRREFYVNTKLFISQKINSCLVVVECGYRVWMHGIELMDVYEKLFVDAFT